MTINSVDNSGVATSQLLRISGSKSGTISTLVPNGRVQIVFTSDYSICYASNPSLYPGLNITFSVDNDNVINNNLHVSGKSIIDGKVGIGTMLPAKKLEIWDGNSGRFTFSAASCTSGYEIAQTIDDIGYKLNIGSSIRNYKISMNGTDKLIISSAGNIGIGTTTTPNYPLEVNGKLRVNNDIYGNKVVSFQDDARFSVTTATVPTLSTSPFSMPQYGIASPNANGSADL
ncbi:MAG TPA: hypothetical protein VFK73_07710, partial [Paludibacter sp.]|nr:hypothetical protein [Paludibacter sp.]